MQFCGRSEGVHVNIAIETYNLIQLGMSVFNFSWGGLDLNVLSWVLTQLFGITIRLFQVGLQSGVT